LPALDDELPKLGVAQPIEAVRRTVRLYATRLSRARGWLESAAGGSNPWLPPDVTDLLAGGPVELRRETVTIEDETEEGVETSEVDIDEALGLDGVSVRSWLEVAQADWDALCGLCWASGLDRVALPDRIEERESFAAVVNESMVRCWHAHDLVRTGGLASRVRQAAPFTWRGMESNGLTRSLAQVAARQYLERRAMFFWLLFPQNKSPFQSDLRKP
jgi:hypothetical protein